MINSNGATEQLTQRLKVKASASFMNYFSYKKNKITLRVCKI